MNQVLSAQLKNNQRKNSISKIETSSDYSKRELGDILLFESDQAHLIPNELIQKNEEKSFSSPFSYSLQQKG